MESFVRRRESAIIRLVTLILFAGCFSGLSIQGYLCIKQFLSKPQAVDITIQPQTKIEMPAITFCPKKAWNLTWAEYCDFEINRGLDTGKFFGSSTKSECQDPEKFWEKLTINHDYEFSRGIMIRFNDENIEFLNPWDGKTKWKEIMGPFGKCYSMVLPKFTKTIQNIRIFTNGSTKFDVVLHSDGILFPRFPWMTMSYGRALIEPQNYFEYDVEYVDRKMLDFGDQQCQSNYEYTKCVEETTKNVPCISLRF